MDAQDEADGVQDIRFAGTVEAGDGVEVRVESEEIVKTISARWQRLNIYLSTKLIVKLTRQSQYNERTI